MMPYCNFKGCKKVASAIFSVVYHGEKYGEAITLCDKHLKKLPYLAQLKQQVKEGE